MKPIPSSTTSGGDDSAPHASAWRVLVAALMLSVGIGILSVAMSGSEAADRDYIGYWGAGHLLLHRSNPYDSAAILGMLRAAGHPAQDAMILRNPPTALFMTLPLGLVGLRSGLILWSLALIAALMASVRMLWVMHGRPQDRLHLIGYIFPPALACLLAGQIGILLLLGMTLFLYLRESHPYLAGAALLLCLTKPHLFLPFGIVLLMWIVSRKTYKILIGAVAAVTASMTLALILDPAVWTQYVHGEKGENIQNLFIPCLSGLLRLVIDRSAVWIQFLPLCAGCVWAVWYFRSRSERWSWTDHGFLLLIVSVMVAPYAWFTDEVVLLPAILAGLYRASNSGRSLLPFGVLAGAALIEVTAGVPLASGLYLWTMPAWLAWYIYSTRDMPQERAAFGKGADSPHLEMQ